MAEDDEEPRKLLVLLGVATVVAGLLIFCLWPREKALAPEPRDQALFGKPFAPVTLGDVRPVDDGKDRGPLEGRDIVRVRSSGIGSAEPMQALLQELKKEPALAPAIEALQASAKEGQPVAPKRMLAALNEQPIFTDALRHAFADQGLAPVLRPLKDDPDVAKALVARAPAAAPSPAPEKQRVFRSETGMSVHGVEEEHAPRPAMPGQRDSKANAVLSSYPFLGQVFTPEQLSALQPDVEAHGVWAACLKAKQFAACQGACAARGRSGDCAANAWSACMGAFHDEKACIRDCKGQAGCEVPLAVFNKHCAAGGFTVPPTYCLGF